MTMDIHLRYNTRSHDSWEEINDKIYQLFNLRSCTPHKDIAERMKKHVRREKYLQKTYIYDEGQLYKGSIASDLSSYPEAAPTQYFIFFIFFHFILFPFTDPLGMFLAGCSHHWDPSYNNKSKLRQGSVLDSFYPHDISYSHLGKREP